ncbi:S-adenosyl-L-methionine-dependent methyltransferase [Hypoxylon sp. FL0543]|nr:S-adenosyl-L-methionine-dependent methyltransferase [Hypoxylon sp. FL0543]
MAPEQTFRAYTQAQGEAYAADRPRYPPKLFEFIIDHHSSTGGQLDTVVDVGCGTGQATRDLAPYFANAIGLDPSKGMISAARHSFTSAISPVRFEVSAAEVLGADLTPPIAQGSIDLLTAATAAHWFDMTKFWFSAARMLKPGGTVAIWARTGLSVDPIMTPNGAAIKAVVDEAVDELKSYMNPGNALSRDLYVNLPLPWTLVDPVEEFDKASFLRKEWKKNEDSAGKEDGDIGTMKAVALEELARVLGSGSPVTRWREAHPDKAGTEEDIVRRLRARIESFLHEVDVDPREEVLRRSEAVVLLMVKKI